jgi:hypothetical protein
MGYVRKSGRATSRLASSKNGNPRFQVTFDDHTSFPTAPDVACAYGIDNSELNGDVWVLIRRGQIVDIRPVDEA